MSSNCRLTPRGCTVQASHFVAVTHEMVTVMHLLKCAILQNNNLDTSKAKTWKWFVTISALCLFLPRLPFSYHSWPDSHREIQFLLTTPCCPDRIYHLELWLQPENLLTHPELRPHAHVQSHSVYSHADVFMYGYGRVPANAGDICVPGWRTQVNEAFG